MSKSKKHKISKVNLVILPLFVVLFVAIFFAIVLNGLDLKGTSTNDENKIFLGRWEIFAVSLNGKYIGGNSLNGQYIDIKNKKAIYNLHGKEENTNWTKIRDNVIALGSGKELLFTYEDKVLKYEEGQNTFFFKKPKETSNNIEKIKLQVAQMSTDVIEDLSANDEGYEGKWFLEKVETSKGIEDKKDENIELVIKDKELTIKENDTTKEAKLKLDENTNTLDVEFKGERAMIFLSKGILVMVKSDSTQYYTRRLESLNAYYFVAQYAGDYYGR